MRVLPGTEISFVGDVVCMPPSSLRWTMERVKYQTAVCRRCDEETAEVSDQDALEFPDGRTVLLTRVREGQAAIVRKLPKSASQDGFQEEFNVEHDVAQAQAAH